MKPVSKRRVLISAGVFATGALAYLSLSGAPLKVHVVTLLVQAVFLSSVSLVAWVLEASRKKQLLAFFLVAAFVAPFATYASCLVIRKIEFQPIYVLMDFLGLLIAATAFLSATWFVDRCYLLWSRRFGTEVSS
ncbi:MAG: hypothetical protein ABJC13_20250 [Acidobacteriota bacterium]